MSDNFRLLGNYLRAMILTDKSSDLTWLFWPQEPLLIVATRPHHRNLQKSLLHLDAKGSSKQPYITSCAEEMLIKENRNTMKRNDENCLKPYIFYPLLLAG